MIREKLLNLVDRRTVIVVLVVGLLFTLAFRGEKIALSAIDGMVFVAISLVGSNAAEGSLNAFANRWKRPSKTTSVKPDKEP